MGNPWVSGAQPIPNPPKTHTKHKRRRKKASSDKPAAKQAGKKRKKHRSPASSDASSQSSTDNDSDASDSDDNEQAPPAKRKQPSAKPRAGELKPKTAEDRLRAKWSNAIRADKQRRAGLQAQAKPPVNVSSAPSVRSTPQPDSPAPAESAPQPASTPQLSPPPRLEGVRIGPPRGLRKKAKGKVDKTVPSDASEASKPTSQPTSAPSTDSPRDDDERTTPPAQSPVTSPSSPSSPVGAPEQPVPTVKPSDVSSAVASDPAQPPTSQPASHQKPSASSPMSSPEFPPPAVDPTWPEWFARNYKALLEVDDDLGEAFVELLQAYIDLEATYGFVKGNPSESLPKNERPAEVGKWIGNGRRSEPLVDDLLTFDIAAWRWWKVLQPAWRQVQDIEGPLTVQHREGNGDWSCLRVPGQNGFLSVVVVLTWWGSTVSCTIDHDIIDRDQCDEVVSWNEAVADVTWVMRKMVDAEAAGVTDEGDDDDEENEDEEEDDDNNNNNEDLANLEFEPASQEV
ncbi:hypothetical protein HGRIS_014198 [Hohenbuehelia grisea]|uniref:Uncharacterized protein n=1 Tax=Hohenbuehelia grisea TaxID=104357 RepID=A0ABR3JTM9_9AGAR